MHTKFSLGRIALTALALSALAQCATTQSMAQSHFRAITLQGVNDGRPDYFIVDNGAGDTYFDLPQPENIFIDNQSKTYTGPDGNVVFSSSEAVNFRGIWSTGTVVTANAANAYYPTDANYGTTPPFGYYALAGGGSWTKNRFVSPLALNDPTATFHWHVSGNANFNLGVASSRLDFAVTTGVADFGNLYNSTITPNRLTKFGQGEYSYNTGVAIDTPLDFLFWGSAYWEVDPNDLLALGTSHRNLYGNANFFDTFNLDGIDLFNGDGSLVNNWSLLDEASGATLFNQNGRFTTTAVPEPSGIALAVSVFLSGGFLFLRRRRKS